MTISFITALIEFGIFLYLVNLFFYSKNKSVALAAAAVFLLATYQLSEYMLCTIASSDLWARIGFATYTFIPVVAFNLFLSLSEKKTIKWVYIFPIFFAIIALLYPGFIVETACKIFYVSVNSFVFRENIIMLILYLIFYSVFPVLGAYIFIKSVAKVFEDTIKLRISIIIFSLAPILGALFFITYNLKYGIIESSYSIMIMLIVTIVATIFSIFVISCVKSYQKFLTYALGLVFASFLIEATLYVISIQFSYDFSSMWCHFAFLYSISCLILAQTAVNEKK